MSEQSMKCKDCALKHIAAAISYGKEILSGHGKNGDPDHRPDFLGELINAEHHLELLSSALHEKLKILRTSLQNKDLTPTPTDVDGLRSVWIAVESEISYETTVDYPKASFLSTSRYLDEDTQLINSVYEGIDKLDGIGLLYDDAWKLDPEKFQILVPLLSKYANNLNRTFFKTDEKFKEYDKKFIWYLPINIFIGVPHNMLRPVLGPVGADGSKDNVPRVLVTEDLKKAIEAHPEDTTSKIINNMEIPYAKITSDKAVCTTVSKQPCCSVSAALKVVPFVKVTDTGWPYMKKIWEGII